MLWRWRQRCLELSRRLSPSFGKDPMRPVRAEVDGLTVEVRRVETPPAAGTSAEE